MKKGPELLKPGLIGEAIKRNSKGQFDKSHNGRNSCGFGRVGIRKDLNQYFRSSWEANIARLLNYYKIPWKYEPKTFVLREISYTPDFQVGNIYLEVKGKYIKNAGDKIKRFREAYPHLNFILIDSKLYRQLERVYHRVIPNWEYR